nr:MAG TPA: hypothetical protein [Crassvirales sp.]
MLFSSNISRSSSFIPYVDKLLISCIIAFNKSLPRNFSPFGVVYSLFYIRLVNATLVI